MRSPTRRGGKPPTTRRYPAKLVVELLVHSADLSNPVLPDFGVVKSWADLVCAEFSAQVAREKAEGLPFAPHMDGLTNPVAVAKLQLGFIDYVVAPLWNSMGVIFPELKVASDNLASNRGKWKAIADGGEPAAGAGAGAAAATTAAPAKA